MRSAKVLLIGLCLMAVSAGAIAGVDAVQEFLVDRDTWISCSDPPYDERYGNGGNSPTGRAAKRAENYALFDWDFDAIQAWIDAQAVPEGYHPVFDLSIRTTAGSFAVFPQMVWVCTINCENDWAEGGGVSGFQNFGRVWGDSNVPPDQVDDSWILSSYGAAGQTWNSTWDVGVPAVTSEYAQTYYTMEDDGTGTLVPTLDALKSVPWIPIYGSLAGTTTNFIRQIREVHHVAPRYRNTEDFVLAPTDAGNIVTVTLDYALVDDLLTNPKNFGLFLDCASHDNNMTIYYKENWPGADDANPALQATIDALANGAPKLTVSFSNAPLDYIWQVPTGDWGVTTNWFPQYLPTPDGTAVFQDTLLGGPNVVTLATDAEVGGVRVSGLQDYEWQGPGVLTLNGTWSHEPAYTGAMDCYVTITGPGNIHTKSGRLDLSPSAANTFTGGVMVGNGSRLYVHRAGALGTGTVEVHGVLYTNADGCLSSPTTGGADFAAVVVGANGRLELNSNETARIEVLPTGALAAPVNPYFSSALDYDWQNGGNVKMHQGAVVDRSLMNLPTEDLLAPGDGVFGIWLGDSDLSTDVGDGGGTIYRGLATTTPVAAGGWTGFDLTSIVRETVGGTLGPMFLSVPGCNFIFNGAFVFADGSNRIKLVGDGDFGFDDQTGASVFNAPVEKTGSGKVTVLADGVLTGTELHVKGGVLTLAAAATGGMSGSDVTIYDGAAFQPRVTKGAQLTGGLTDLGTLT
ncbi:MAG TPA: hypothetical protein VM389_07145, partial [Phycisphaerae bacterium]|nr:hypothetical protein [Phycisphaerae bacterium]